MAFPSAFGTNRTLGQALGTLNGNAAQTKAQSISIRDKCLAGTASATEILTFMTNLADIRTSMDLMAAVPGLSAFAQTQYNNPGLDIVSQYNAMIAAIDAARIWMRDNFPRAATTLEALERTIDANGRTVARVFTAPSVAPLASLLDTVIASID